MMIIGVDYHPSFQQIAFFVEETGECGERRLDHDHDGAEHFYRDLKQRGISVRRDGGYRIFTLVRAATGRARLRDMDRRSSRDQYQTSQEAKDGPPGCATSVEAAAGRSLSSDLDTESGESGSTATTVAPASAGADAHTNHESVAGLGDEREQVLEEEAVEPTGTSRIRKASIGVLGQPSRQELLELLDRMNPVIDELTAAVEKEARKRPEVLRLMTHPGVGALTALAYVLIIGTPQRFACAKQIGNYLGLIPSEDSSGGRQRLAHITKQGSSLLRFLLVEAAQAAVRSNSDWRRRYRHLAMRRQRNIAKVAMGRRLGVRLYWMWRNDCEYSPSLEFGSHAGECNSYDRGVESFVNKLSGAAVKPVSHCALLAILAAGCLSQVSKRVSPSRASSPGRSVLSLSSMP
jgi:transposase